MTRKTEDGEQYPAEAYLYVPDPEKPSTWKLRIWEDPQRKVTRAQLGRAAAALTKGFRGNVVDIPLEERRVLAKKLVQLYRSIGVPDEEIPPDLRELAGIRLSKGEIVDVDALLFKAGSYSDKNVVVSEEDLDEWVRNFRDSREERGVPVLVEHKDSPLRLGWVTRIWREGDRLWGRLSLFKGAYEWLRSIGIRSLSVGIDVTNKRLHEVSVVGFPRVKEASFGDEVEIVHIEREFLENNNEETADEIQDSVWEEAYMDTRLEEMSARIAQLEADLKRREEDIQLERQKRMMLEFAIQKKDMEHAVDELIHTGKLPPALRDTLIQLGISYIQFSDGVTSSSSENLQNAFQQFLEAVRNLPSWTTNYPSVSSSSSSEEVSFLKRMGYSDEEVKQILEQVRR